MGHERIGFLPKTKQWQSIVQNLSDYVPEADITAKIANDILNSVRNSYEAMPYDESVSKAIKFLALLSVSAKKSDQIAYLNQNGCEVDQNISLFSLINSAKDYITTETGSLEVNKIARDAVLQTVTSYQNDHTSHQLTLFSEQSTTVWNEVGSGAAFCELARSFFAAFTERQIQYYVGREAARAIDDYSALQSFNIGITKAADAISHHAFETSKIMQSFAAGWFNKHATGTIPDDKHVTDFLRTSFGKMREEFRREAEGI